MGTERRALNYNVGAVVIFFVSMALAAIVYAAGIIPFDLFDLLAWAFGPLGVYTLIYSVIVAKIWLIIWLGVP